MAIFRKYEVKIPLFQIYFFFETFFNNFRSSKNITLHKIYVYTYVFFMRSLGWRPTRCDKRVSGTITLVSVIDTIQFYTMLYNTIK